MDGNASYLFAFKSFIIYQWSLGHATSLKYSILAKEQHSLLFFTNKCYTETIKSTVDHYNNVFGWAGFLTTHFGLYQLPFHQVLVTVRKQLKWTRRGRYNFFSFSCYTKHLLQRKLMLLMQYYEAEILKTGRHPTGQSSVIRIAFNADKTTGFVMEAEAARGQGAGLWLENEVQQGWLQGTCFPVGLGAGQCSPQLSCRVWSPRYGLLQEWWCSQAAVTPLTKIIGEVNSDWHPQCMAASASSGASPCPEGCVEFQDSLKQISAMAAFGHFWPGPNLNL